MKNPKTYEVTIRLTIVTESGEKFVQNVADAYMDAGREHMEDFDWSGSDDSFEDHQEDIEFISVWPVSPAGPRP